MKRDIHITKRV